MGVIDRCGYLTIIHEWFSFLKVMFSSQRNGEQTDSRVSVISDLLYAQYLYLTTSQSQHVTAHHYRAQLISKQLISVHHL